MTHASYRAIGVSITYVSILAQIGAAGFFGSMVLDDPLAPVVFKIAFPALAAVLIVLAIGLGVAVVRERREDRLYWSAPGRDDSARRRRRASRQARKADAYGNLRLLPSLSRSEP